MAFNKTQPMRPAELDLIDAVDDLTGDYSDLSTSVASIESDIDTLQSSMSTAESDIDTLQSNVSGLMSGLSDITTLNTIDYIDYISPATDVTISSATLIKLGRIAMLHVAFSYAGTLVVDSQKNMFDITGPYAPIAACPASVNGTGANALINTSKALWVKTSSSLTFTGSHYADCIYITAS